MFISKPHHSFLIGALSARHIIRLDHIARVTGRPLKVPATRHRRSSSKAGRRRFVLYAALRQRRQASRPPKAATSPGSPAPAMGPGTVEMLPPYPEVPPPVPVNSA